MELDPHLCPEEIMSREVVLGWASWTSFASRSCPSCSSTAVQRTLSSAEQLKEQLRSAQVAGQWRGDTALTLPLFWRRSTVSPVFFGRFPGAVEPFTLSPPSHSVPVPNRPTRLCGRKATLNQGFCTMCWKVLVNPYPSSLHAEKCVTLPLGRGLGAEKC